MKFNFDNMYIFGADKLSVLAMESVDQASKAMSLYNSVTTGELSDKLLTFIDKYGDSEPGLLNFSGSMLTLALSNDLLTPQQLTDVIDSINRKASSYDSGERFSYFRVPFNTSKPKGRIIIREPDYDKVVNAIELGDKESYAQLVEKPAHNIKEDLINFSMAYGLERCLLTGPLIDDLLK